MLCVMSPYIYGEKQFQGLTQEAINWLVHWIIWTLCEWPNWLLWCQFWHSIVNCSLIRLSNRFSYTQFLFQFCFRYSCYLILLKRKVPNEEQMDIPMFFGKCFFIFILCDLVFGQTLSPCRATLLTWQASSASSCSNDLVQNF